MTWDMAKDNVFLTVMMHPMSSLISDRICKIFFMSVCKLSVINLMHLLIFPGYRNNGSLALNWRNHFLEEEKKCLASNLGVSAVSLLEIKQGINVY